MNKGHAAGLFNKNSGHGVKKNINVFIFSSLKHSLSAWLNTQLFGSVIKIHVLFNESTVCTAAVRCPLQRHFTSCSLRTQLKLEHTAQFCLLSTSTKISFYFEHLSKQTKKKEKSNKNYTTCLHPEQKVRLLYLSFYPPLCYINGSVYADVSPSKRAQLSGGAREGTCFCRIRITLHFKQITQKRVVLHYFQNNQNVWNTEKWTLNPQLVDVRTKEG